MTVAVIVLAVLGATLAASTVMLTVRLQGIRSELSDTQIQLAAALANEADNRRVADLATEAASQVRLRLGAIEATRRAEIERLQELAARCTDPGEIRAWLTELTSKGRPS